MNWIYDKITVEGDRIGEDGKPMAQVLDLWRRNPMAVIQELIGNPAFRDAMSYTPERVFEDEEKMERVIDEMCTADWWWDIQVSVVVEQEIQLD